MLDRFNILIARLATLDLRREEGQAMVEYAFVIAAVVAIAAGVALSGLGTAIGDKLTSVASSISG